MKKSTFLFLKLFVVASVLTSFLTMLPYTYTVLLIVKEKFVQTISDGLPDTYNPSTTVQ